MRRLLIAASALASLVFAAAAVAGGHGQHNMETFHASLKGYEEVPTVSTFATGFLTLKIDRAGESIAYELSFENLQGTVTQSHIHFGQMGVAGGISLWLCQTAGTPAPAAVADITPMCPAGGTVSGTLTAVNVIGPTAQLIAAGEMSEIIAAIEAGFAYGNVHSSSVPGGEIRGQIR
jgi:hypothetical protein